MRQRAVGPVCASACGAGWEGSARPAVLDSSFGQKSVHCARLHRIKSLHHVLFDLMHRAATCADSRHRASILNLNGHKDGGRKRRGLYTDLQHGQQKPRPRLVPGCSDFKLRSATRAWALAHLEGQLPNGACCRAYFSLVFCQSARDSLQTPQLICCRFGVALYKLCVISAVSFPLVPQPLSSRSLEAPGARSTGSTSANLKGSQVSYIYYISFGRRRQRPRLL
ncbi:hypothetical protein OBBRIDRAFT_571834 [Obba rivulosa]|uniref:Uncharacterized protein n=1 Tax=Obba rivulosa TaxID=1052685 RepID=A0A8E2B3N6_9APHY|nr:hypothetical protein OBBRIDRAFT_571834 [Obba rivulosa]